jgi:hypothetical protein
VLGIVLIYIENEKKLDRVTLNQGIELRCNSVKSNKCGG